MRVRNGPKSGNLGPYPPNFFRDSESFDIQLTYIRVRKNSVENFQLGQTSLKVARCNVKWRFIQRRYLKVARCNVKLCRDRRQFCKNANIKQSATGLFVLYHQEGNIFVSTIFLLRFLRRGGKFIDFKNTQQLHSNFEPHCGNFFGNSRLNSKMGLFIKKVYPMAIQNWPPVNLTIFQVLPKHDTQHLARNLTQTEKRFKLWIYNVITEGGICLHFTDLFLSLVTVITSCSLLTVILNSRINIPSIIMCVCNLSCS